MLAAEKGLELRYRATQVWVHTDAQMLRRVVQNFLTNAVRYTERGAILLGARRRGDHVWIQVWDSGPGIAEHDRTAIFEEFRRLDRGGRGLGLGLAIAERMAHLLDAELALASRLGHGSVFSIGLATCAPAEAPRSEVVERVDAPALRVLVVDNDAAVLQGMQALLESWGCSVRVARQSAELQAQLRDFPPDMLMLDYHLDGGDTGLALRQRLPEALQQLPCVLITADHDLAIRQAAEAAGCTVLHKPLKPLALKSVMARVRGAA